MPSGARLKDIVASRYPNGNVWIGATTSYNAISNQMIDAVILNREFSFTTPENDFKQSMVHPTPGSGWSWNHGDLFIDSASKNRQVMRLHGPVSPQSSKWVLDDNRTGEDLEGMMREWVTAICQRYNASPVVRWLDVVNETIEADGKWFGPKPGTEKWENPWTSMGADQDENRTPLYISKAFELANQFAPRLKLVYNQHTSLEKAGVEKLKETILYLKQKGLRVDAIGWQAHLAPTWHEDPQNLKTLSGLISWAHQHQLEFHITENNIKIKKEVPGSQEFESVRKEFYSAIFRVLLEHRETGVVGWNCWHVTDYESKKEGGFALLFDAKGAPTDAYYAVQAILENPPAPIK
ncbi:MAG: endo-1,4-beta-xylanase [Spirochaetia bacterium]|nr:endo-1,4-beta-xylanase [Spirochaetia bacterium]